MTSRPSPSRSNFLSGPILGAVSRSNMLRNIGRVFSQLARLLDLTAMSGERENDPVVLTPAKSCCSWTLRERILFGCSTSKGMLRGRTRLGLSRDVVLRKPPPKLWLS